MFRLVRTAPSHKNIFAAFGISEYRQSLISDLGQRLYVTITAKDYLSPTFFLVLLIVCDVSDNGCIAWGLSLQDFHVSLNPSWLRYPNMYGSGLICIVIYTSHGLRVVPIEMNDCSTGRAQSSAVQSK